MRLTRKEIETRINDSYELSNNVLNTVSYPVVTVRTSTYQHAPYIKDCIEGILMQKTTFSIEYIIGEDCSTDGTREIVFEYAKKYPNIMRVITADYNISAKANGVRCGRASRGKYMALCEGDDYWTDPYKLQKQVDYMEKHSECSLCVHAALQVNPEKEKLSTYIRPNVGNTYFGVEEVIKGRGAFFATNSILYPRKWDKKRPAFLEEALVPGDYPLVIYLALMGKVYYMDEFMSAYRVGVRGSWVSRNFSTLGKRIAHFNDLYSMFDDLNRHSEYKYNNTIEDTKNNIQFGVLREQGKYREIKMGKYRKIYNTLGPKDKCRIFIKQYFPLLARSIVRFKNIQKKIQIMAMKIVL